MPKAFQLIFKQRISLLKNYWGNDFLNSVKDSTDIFQPVLLSIHMDCEIRDNNYLNKLREPHSDSPEGKSILYEQKALVYILSEDRIQLHNSFLEAMLFDQEFPFNTSQKSLILNPCIIEKHKSKFKGRRID